MSDDLSALAPEARPVVRRAAEIYLMHTRPWFIGLIAHGSAVKGGFIPHCSDIDLQLYLDDAAFSERGLLPLSICAAIDRELAEIDRGPFQYIQCLVFRPRLREPFLGPIPGTYQVIAGRLPVPEARADALLSAARAGLAQLEPFRMVLADELLTCGGGTIERAVRKLATKVWTVLYHMLVVRTGAPLQIWGLPKPQAIALVSEGEPSGQAIRAFDRALRAFYSSGQEPHAGVTTFEQGVSFLCAAKLAWQAER